MKDSISAFAFAMILTTVAFLGAMIIVAILIVLPIAYLGGAFQ